MSKPHKSKSHMSKPEDRKVEIIEKRTAFQGYTRIDE